MASEPKTIEVEPGSELERVLAEARDAPLRLVSGGERFRVDREHDDIWEGYDPDRAIEGIRKAAGAWKGIVDADEFKAYVRERRKTKNRPPVEW